MAEVSLRSLALALVRRSQKKPERSPGERDMWLSFCPFEKKETHTKLTLEPSGGDAHL